MRAVLKYEGLGNDFVLVDGRSWPGGALSAAQARELCDRHRGVGGDGVLWVLPLGEATVRMVVLNADGSRPEMCGNGVRCVAAWAHAEGLVRGSRCVVVSDAGPRPSRVERLGDDTYQVTVAMGRAKVLPAPALARVPERTEPVAVRVVDLGNPHGVLFDPPEAPSLVRAVEALEAFPHGVNVELVTTTAEGFRVRVHERGVGWTQACGTGACAVVAAAVATGRAVPAVPQEVTLDGGMLSITVDRTGEVHMTGPARRVFYATLR